MQQVTTRCLVSRSCFCLLCASAYPRSVDFIFFFLTASEIVKNIQARKWTALAVLEAYIARGAQAHEATNCFTEGTSAAPLAMTTLPWALTFP
jgi:hypothetical protein